MTYWKPQNPQIWPGRRKLHSYNISICLVDDIACDIDATDTKDDNLDNASHRQVTGVLGLVALGVVANLVL